MSDIRRVRNVFNPITESLEEIKGEPHPDITAESFGQVTGSFDDGIQHTNRLDRGKIPVHVRYTGFYGDKVCTIDVYPMGLGNDIDPGSNKMAVVLYCPRCTKGLTIREQNKRMLFDPVKKELSVERFTCTQELTDKARGGVTFGVTLCKFTAGIEKNIMRDA